MTTHEPAPSVTDMAQAVAAAHHASLQRQQQHAMWVNVASEAVQNHFRHSMNDHDDDEDDDPTEFQEQDAEAVAVSMAAAAAAAYGGGAGTELPHPPTLQNLEEIADLIAAAQLLPQRESLANCISKKDFSYLKDLLTLFDPAEARQDYGALATLAACVKTILLLNDPSVIDFIVNDERVYEQVCSALEYDPDLRDKANHRWFLKDRAKFRTVVLMEVCCGFIHCKLIHLLVANHFPGRGAYQHYSSIIQSYVSEGYTSETNNGRILVVNACFAADVHSLICCQGCYLPDKECGC